MTSLPRSIGAQQHRDRSTHPAAGRPPLSYTFPRRRDAREAIARGICSYAVCAFRPCAQEKRGERAHSNQRHDCCGRMVVGRKRADTVGIAAGARRPAVVLDDHASRLHVRAAQQRPTMPTACRLGLRGQRAPGACSNVDTNRALSPSRRPRSRRCLFHLVHVDRDRYNPGTLRRV